MSTSGIQQGPHQPSALGVLLRAGHLRALAHGRPHREEVHPQQRAAHPVPPPLHAGRRRSGEQGTQGVRITSELIPTQVDSF